MALSRSNTQPCIRPSCHIVCTGVALRWLKPWKSETSKTCDFIHGHRSEFSGWGPGFTQCRIARLWCETHWNNVKHNMWNAMMWNTRQCKPMTNHRNPKPRVREHRSPVCGPQNPSKYLGNMLTWFMSDSCHSFHTHTGRSERILTAPAESTARNMSFDMSFRVLTKEHVIRHVIQGFDTCQWLTHVIQDAILEWSPLSTSQLQVSYSESLRMGILGVSWNYILGCLGIISWDILELYLGISWNYILGYLGIISWDILELYLGISWNYILGYLGIISWDILEFYLGISWNYILGYLGIISWDILELYLGISWHSGVESWMLCVCHSRRMGRMRSWPATYISSISLGPRNAHSLTTLMTFWCILTCVRWCAVSIGTLFCHKVKPC